jgi:hypothetical protein
LASSQLRRRRHILASIETHVLGALIFQKGIDTLWALQHYYVWLTLEISERCGVEDGITVEGVHIHADLYVFPVAVSQNVL